jgi:hypothetical protein
MLAGMARRSWMWMRIHQDSGSMNDLLGVQWPSGGDTEAGKKLWEHQIWDLSWSGVV